MIGKALIAVGLVFDIAGATLIWRYGLPEMISREGKNYLTFTPKPDQSEIDKAKTFDRYSQLGMVLLILGFLLQLVGTLIPTGEN